VTLLVVARQVARHRRWRVSYAVSPQGWAMTAWTVGLVFGGDPVFWAAIVRGVPGAALVIQKEEAFGS
jgi:hypothetical protein